MQQQQQQQQQPAANPVANPAIQAGTPVTPESNQFAQIGAPGANADLSSNFQNYLIQYQHQNANTSPPILGAMGTQGASNRIGAPPLDTSGAAGKPSSQAISTPVVDTPFKFPGYQQQLP